MAICHLIDSGNAEELIAKYAIIRNGKLSYCDGVERQQFKCLF